MNYLLIFFTSLVISMAIIPLMMRCAPYLGMLDIPDQRKVHAAPIPRVGGTGIVIGTLVPLLMWVPMDAALQAYLFGSLVLLVFGMWDDARNLGPYPKFIGQFLAVAAVVYYADIYVTTLPFMGLDPLQASIAKPFTMFAIIGMINALNVSDGLDGLAGGLSVLSLSCIAYLATLADAPASYASIAVVVATLGGVFGFLRYNTYPARVFMGDGGSQFIGFTLGYLAVVLLQRVNLALSPSLPLLFLGLPIVDIFFASVQRYFHGISPFAASKHHIHHHLLALGFDHYEAVVIIYSIHTLFILSAIWFGYEADWLIMSLYLVVSATLLISLRIASRNQWQAHRSRSTSAVSRVIGAMKGHKLLVVAPLGLVKTAIPLLFVSGALWADKVPRDLGIASLILFPILGLQLLRKNGRDTIVIHAVNFVTAAFVLYLETKYFTGQPAVLEKVELGYFSLLAIAVGLVVRFVKENQFKTTPTDYLVILVVVFAGALVRNSPDAAVAGSLAVKLIIVFYGCELIITHTRSLWSALNLASLAALIILAVRGVA